MIPVLLLVALGCGRPFGDEDAVRTWANTASPVAVYAHAYGVLAHLDGAEVLDGSCPTIAENGDLTTFTGGCGTGDDAWQGVAEVRAVASRLEILFDGYGQGNESALDGAFARDEVAAEAYTFHADLVHTSGVTTTLRYDGEVRGDYDASTWSGAGRVAREGGVAPRGEIEAETADEVVDDTICSGQPVSGTTTLRSGSDEVVITYDGGEDCDSEQAARWSRNGADRGLLTGVSCASAPGFSPAALLLVFAAWLRLRPRRALP